MNKHSLGVANLWVVILLPVMVGFIGMSIDMGYMALVAQQLQTCADAASLAGAARLRADIDEARAAAATVASLNHAADGPMLLDWNTANAADGDIVVGRFNRKERTFTPQLESVNVVLVRARRTGASLNGPVNLLFGPALNLNHANMQRTAVAMVGGGTGAGLIVLDPDGDRALYVHGNVRLSVNDGAIQINSAHDRGGVFQGNVELHADLLNCVGDYQLIGRPVMPADIYTGQNAVPDPLADLPEPRWEHLPDFGTIDMTGGTVTAEPGYYSGGISTNGGTLHFEPGIYILDGAGLDIGGNANVFAHGCMFYIKGTGRLNLVGTGRIELSPPDPDNGHTFDGADTYGGVTVFQARDNANISKITGTSDMDLEGTYYFPANQVNISGDSMQCGNQLIAYRLDISGNGNLTIHYKGSFPAPGNRVFLVQ